MLDVKFVRDNLELAKQRLATRGLTTALDDFERLDAERRAKITEADRLKAERNRLSQEIGQLMRAGEREKAEALRAQAKDLPDRIKQLDAKSAEVEAQLNAILSTVPNLPHDSVPVGADETANTEVRRWGDVPRFDFEPKDHIDLGTSLGILDTERAAKITGARFAVLPDLGARLERALINFMLDVQTKEHGYREMWLPFIINNESLFGTGQLPKFEADLFKLAVEQVRDLTEDQSAAGRREFYLVPTAEVPLVNLYRGEILDGADLPINLTAYTPCFRSEAGSYGKDVRGLIRQHQFDKVELVKFTRPEDSYDELENLTHHAETILQRLGLAYRVMLLSTGDMGFASSKTYDLEVWIPSRNRYREISSCSNCEAFQARRADIRFRRERGAKPEYVHTLNGSGLAVGRTWLAILENYQQANGSVIVPEALRPYLDGLERMEPKMDRVES
ncbi:MAG: serine--tRNA ligase [Acidobacteria bacterium]|nr:serine--tRNA ligase [Acidobacteriota bacterium]